MFPARPLWANNLSITNVSLESRTASCDRVTVQFDIDWSNSWSDSTNRDGVWVFFKVCKNSCSEWVHGKMKTSGTDPADTSGGSSGTDLTVEVPTDLAGAFLYRSSTGTGAVSTDNVELALDFAASPLSASATDDIQVRVFGVEMVYVPTHSFYLGAEEDLSSSYHFFFNAGDSSDPRSTISIGSGTIYISEKSDGNGTWGDIAWDEDSDCGSLPSSRTALGANFPTGYDAFWVMKYEVSQALYRDFLNTLTTAAQANRVDDTTHNNFYTMYDRATIQYRNIIKYKSSGTPFVCDLDGDHTGDEADDGEWIAMGYMIYPDCAALADWAGLRPITEMEFEKAALGTASHAAVFASGSDSPTGRVYEPLSNGGTSSEVPDVQTSSNKANWFSTSDSFIEGPLRVGWAANATTDRGKACATYYGALDFSGNVAEYTVTIGNADGRAFEGSHGDGVLSTTSSYEGNATNTDWPGIDGTVARGVTGAAGSGRRGGGFKDYPYTGRMQSRDDAADEVTSRDDGSIEGLGCRLGRSE